MPKGKPKQPEAVSQVEAEIDDLTPKELADGLRLALIAFRIKANRVKTGRDRDWMRSRAALMASALLSIATGGAPL